jgi:hypothetical protein
LPQWREELNSEIIVLWTNLTVYRDRARELTAEQPDRAREIWQSIIGLYGDRPWAREFVQEAQNGLLKLGPPPDSPAVTDGNTEAETRVESTKEKNANES